MKDSRLIIITGLSGSGKSIASKALEDVGYFCIDNLPVALLPKLIELGAVGRGSEIERFALVMDAREATFPANANDLFTRLRADGYNLEIVFLQASDDVLQRRYSTTRRGHPAAAGGSVGEGIQRERESMANLMEIADWVVDTSMLTPHDLRRAIQDRYADSELERLRVQLVTFGFRHGLPADADLVIDVRFVPNPFFVDSLKPLTGLEKPVADYVLENDVTRKFLERFDDLLDFLLPHYEHEGKTYLTIAIGCTGGRHRSVAIAEKLAQKLLEQKRMVSISHRDIEK
ncbi:MAG TPA: RNase adapter RapZ [bacterium]|nr:RNase adapter RapZ [bacterium]